MELIQRQMGIKTTNANGCGLCWRNIRVIAFLKVMVHQRPRIRLVVVLVVFVVQDESTKVKELAADACCDNE